jgi:hypothetical protein
VSTCPTSAVPLIDGGAVLTGLAGAAMTTAVCAEVADALLVAFVPVYTTRIVAPMSPATIV